MASVSMQKVKIDRPLKVRSEGPFGLAAGPELTFQLLPRVVPVVVLLVLPLVLSPYWTKVVTYACVITLLALSWDLFHNVGLLSLGQALLFGVGAYITGSLNHYLGIHPLISVPVAAVTGGAVCTLLLLPLMRLRGLYFAMVTLAMAAILVRIIEATGILGGTTGLSALSTFPNQAVETYVLIVVTLVVVFGLRRMDRSDFGVILRGIGENDRTVLASGINVFWYKTKTLYLGSVIGCFAGAYMTHVITSVGIAAFAMDNSILPVASVVVGGAGTFAGAVLGAFILIPLSEFLRSFGELRIVFYCLVLVFFTVQLPAGIFPYLRRKYFQTTRRMERNKANDN